jgi:hypothetical protein
MNNEHNSQDLWRFAVTIIIQTNLHEIGLPQFFVQFVEDRFRSGAASSEVLHVDLVTLPNILLSFPALELVRVLAVAVAVGLVVTAVGLVSVALVASEAAGFVGNVYTAGISVTMVEVGAGRLPVFLVAISIVAIFVRIG